LRLWNIETGYCEKEFCKKRKKSESRSRRKDWIQSIKVSSDGRYIFSEDGEKKIKIWDVDSGKYIKLERVKRFIASIALSDCGRYLACASSSKETQPGILTIWKLRSGKGCITQGSIKEIFSIETKVGGTLLAFSSNGQYLALGLLDGGILLFQSKSSSWKDYRLIRKYKGHEKQVRSICFDSRGERLFSAGEAGIVCMYDVETLEIMYRHETKNRIIFALELSSDDKKLLIGTSDNGLEILDLKTLSCEVFKKKGIWMCKVVCSCDDKYVAFSSSSRYFFIENLMDKTLAGKEPVKIDNNKPVFALACIKFSKNRLEKIKKAKKYYFDDNKKRRRFIDEHYINPGYEDDYYKNFRFLIKKSDKNFSIPKVLLI